jgi:hypothetical protein
MKTKRVFYFVIALIGALILAACGAVNIDLGSSDAQSPETEGAVDGADASAQDSPAEAAVSGALVPDGVLVSTGNETSLTYLDVNGQVIAEIETPGIITLDADDAVIAGAVVPGEPMPPVIYRSWLPDQAIMANKNGQAVTLRPIDSFLSMTSAPGQPAVAFSEVLLNEDNYPHSFLYAGNPDNLGTVGSFYDLVDAPNYMALIPVGIETVGGEPQGVWYTKTGWGIGGADLIFPITRGLFFFDLTSGRNTQFIDAESGFQGISPDLGFAGLVDLDFEGNREMTVVNLTNNERTHFAPDPATDRGAGFAVFSPDSRYAAWLEAAGSMISDPYDFHPRVRVGDISSGGVVQVLDDSAAVVAINGAMVTFMRPAGWLSSESLLVEVRGQNWDDVTLLRFDIATGAVSVFASGSFISFGYQ